MVALNHNITVMVSLRTLGHTNPVDNDFMLMMQGFYHSGRVLT